MTIDQEIDQCISLLSERLSDPDFWDRYRKAEQMVNNMLLAQLAVAEMRTNIFGPKETIEAHPDMIVVNVMAPDYRGSCKATRIS